VSDALDLTAAQARVLGALIEKAFLTPDAYPLSLKALTTACNQTTSRDPVVDYEPGQVETTLLALKAKGLVRVVHPGAGERATRYRQVLEEVVPLGQEELALLCVMLLRGAQTAPELRSRTERMSPLPDSSAVEATLAGLAARTAPLTQRLAPAVGQREARWIQLLEAGAEARAAAGTSAAASLPGPRRSPHELEARVAWLEARIERLIAALGDLVDVAGLDAESAGGVERSLDVGDEIVGGLEADGEADERGVDLER
jgi:uncharacterized protein YceH (UPF0502 family)